MKNEYPPLGDLLNTIIPGDDRWPLAAEAITEPTLMMEAFDIVERQEILDLASRLADLPETERARAFTEFEAASTDLCRRLIARVMRDYYQSPAAHACVIALAESGPREASPFFDESQLAQMRARTGPHVSATRQDKTMINHKPDPRANPAIELSSPPGMFKGPTYEHAARFGDFIFVAGQVAKDEAGALIAPNNAAGQAKVVFEHLRQVLQHVGATPQDIVKMTTYLVDRADSRVVTAERFLFLGDHRPPHTGVVIAGLGAPEVKLEVEVIAVAPKRTA